MTDSSFMPKESVNIYGRLFDINLVKYWKSEVDSTHMMLIDSVITLVDTVQSLRNSAFQTNEVVRRNDMPNDLIKEYRKIIFDFYGLSEAPYGNYNLPLGFVLGRERDPYHNERLWHINCFLCHSGRVRGESTLGAPNTLLDLQTLENHFHGKNSYTSLVFGDDTTYDMTRGTNSAFFWSARLLGTRKKDLRQIEDPDSVMVFGDLTAVDLDATPWWTFRKKTRLYSDGFAQKTPRALMQFTMAHENSAEQIKQWEDDFANVLAWLDSIPAPVYPEEKIDRELAGRGETVFRDRCAGCHGTYGEQETYPEITIPLAEIGTDPLRLTKGLTPEFRQYFGESWLGYYGRTMGDSVVAYADPDTLQKQIVTRIRPIGYIAPPLDGIWASAPYFHNGSVPTLHDLLNPKDRPTLWRITDPDGYDDEKMGLMVETPDAIPKEYERAPYMVRQYYDISLLGKDNRGHEFQKGLGEEEKKSLLEYLKTL